jgi:hypothetical protein
MESDRSRFWFLEPELIKIVYGVKNWTQNWIPSSIFLWTETEIALIYFLVPKSEVFHTSQEPPDSGAESGHLGPRALH